MTSEKLEIMLGRDTVDFRRIRSGDGPYVTGSNLLEFYTSRENHDRSIDSAVLLDVMMDKLGQQDSELKYTDDPGVVAHVNQNIYRGIQRVNGVVYKQVDDEGISLCFGVNSKNDVIISRRHQANCVEIYTLQEQMRPIVAQAADSLRKDIDVGTAYVLKAK